MEDTYGFIGFGLIGGSIAKAIKKAKPDCSIIAYQPDHNTIDSHIENSLLLAKKECIIQIITTSLEAFSCCDIIFLCAPVLSNIEYLEKLTTIVKPDCIITDVGSVKGNICNVASSLSVCKNFIGGHPMTGSEKTGYENAKEYLFENAFYILTPNIDTKPEFLTRLKQFVQSINAIPVILDAKEHDNIVAAISHVPHILASSLVSMIKDNDDKNHTMLSLAAGGFKDITRIASSSPIMWQNICLTNKESIQTFLTLYKDTIDSFLQLLVPEKEKELLHFFENAKEYRDSIPASVNGILSKTYELYLDIIDESGAIALVASLLASHKISIKNIGIIHNREFQDGVLRIEFYDIIAMEQAIVLFQQHNYTIYER
mgnify:CR=1 FL=1